MPSIPSIVVPSLHGPAGSVAVNTTQPRGLIAMVTMTWNTPSWNRIVGAQTPPPVATSWTATCSGRVATLPICCQVSRSVLRYTGMPGRYSKVEVTR